MEIFYLDMYNLYFLPGCDSADPKTTKCCDGVNSDLWALQLALLTGESSEEWIP